MKIRRKTQSHTRVRRIRTFPFSSDSAYDYVVYDLVKTTPIMQCTFPRFVIGFVLPLLLVTPTTQFSLDRNDGIVSGIRTLFSLDRKVLRFLLRLRLGC